MPEVKVVIEGGKATPAAPLGPALGPLGVNVADIVAEINEKTKNFAGMKVPVTVDVDVKTKGFQIEVGIPPVSALLIKEANVPKGAGNPKLQPVGNLTFEQIKKVAEMKLGSLGATEMKTAVREVAGSCVSVGLTIEGKPAKEFVKELLAGVHDSRL